MEYGESLQSVLSKTAGAGYRRRWPIALAERPGDRRHPQNATHSHGSCGSAFDHRLSDLLPARIPFSAPISVNENVDSADWRDQAAVGRTSLVRGSHVN